LLVARAERDRRAQKRAMERLCGGPSSSSSLLWSLSIGDDGNDGEDVVAPRRTTLRGLYPEKRGIPRRPAPRSSGHRNVDTLCDDYDDDNDDDCDRGEILLLAISACGESPL
jgi:hypothetical protein